MGFNNSPGLFAGSTISVNRFVQLDTTANNRVVQGTDNARCIGISQEGCSGVPGIVGLDPTIAAYGPNTNPFGGNHYGDQVRIYSLGDVCRLRYGGAITAGAQLRSAADGSGLTAANSGDIVCAYALESGTLGMLGYVQIVTPHAYYGGAIVLPLLGNLRLYLKPDAGIMSGLGNPVTLWSDQSGAGNNATPVAGATGLVLTANAQNGLPMVAFNGINDGMLANGVASVLSGGLKPFSMAFVGKYTGMNEAAWLVAASSANANQPYQTIESASPSGSLPEGLFTEREDDTGRGFSEINPAASIGTAVVHVVILTFDGTTQAMYLDGASIGTAAAADTTTLTLDTFGIGFFPYVVAPGPGNDGEFLQGSIGDTAVWNVALAAPQVAQAQASLKGRWNTP